MDLTTLSINQLESMKTKAEKSFVTFAESGQVATANKYNSDIAKIEAELLRRESSL